jgi:hypothetical protein
LFELLFNCLPFPKVKRLKDLELFFDGQPQVYIDNKLNALNIIAIEQQDQNMQRFLYIINMLLQVNPMLRASAEEVHMYLNNLQVQVIKDTAQTQVIKDTVQTQVIKDTIKDTCQTQTQTQDNIVKSQLNLSSWEDISRGNSVGGRDFVSFSKQTGIKVKRIFWEWLFRNT